MQRFIAAVLSALVGLTISGCYTDVSVSRADAEAEGIRYCLPRPHVVVTPKPDGKVDVEVVMLPDESQEYTIDVDSFMSAHLMDIEVKDRMLQSVKYETDSTAVASQAATSAANVAQAAIDNAAAAAKAERMADEEQRKSVAALEAKLRMAKATHQATEQQYGVGSAEEKKAAVELAVAQAAYDAAVVAAQEAGAFNVPKWGGPDAPAPVVFRVNEECDGPKLVALNYEVRGVETKRQPQPRLRTYKAPEAATVVEALKLTPRGSRQIEVKPNETPKITLVSTKVIDEVVEGDCHLEDENGEPIKQHGSVVATLQNGGLEIVIDLEKQLVTGEYWLQLVIKTEKKPDKKTPSPVQLKVTRTP